MKKKSIMAVLLSAVMVTGLFGAVGTEAAASDEERTIKLGLTGVIYEDIWDPIKEALAEEGITLEYVQFSDFSLPNAALDAGEIDINAFQHHAYFENDVESNGYDITAIGDTFIIAMNIYSDKISSVDELQDGDVVAIPDDASNGGRALKVLESAGVITISEEAGSNPTVSDIESYNVEIKIEEMGAANIPSIIPDVAAAVCNGNYALDYGIDPETAIFEETEYEDDSYFCLIAVRSDEVDDPVFAEIVELFQSETTKAIFEDTFSGYFVPAWEVELEQAETELTQTELSETTE
ncbi:MAG: MetQ/NlpA family ABC transporter substrate-binding protein [Lachnospiraceae bacterium]|nr:MetQ/NlpA family ABC transporter substrate-binding protein [Lachnospiraceae bacterium]